MESNQIYRAIVENSITGVFVHQDGKYVYVNDKFAEIHGYTPDELLGMEYLELVHPEEKEMIQDLVSQRFTQDSFAKSRYEVRRIRKDGTITWCEMMASNIQFKGRLAIMGNIIDISERKRVEEALKESEERYRELVETSPVGIGIMIDERAVYANTALARMLRVDVKDILGQYLIDFVHPDDRHIVRGRINSLKSGKRTVLSEYRMVRSDNNYIDVEVMSANITYQDRRAVQAVFRDITERKQVEEQLRESEERYHSIFEQALDGIVLVDIDTGLIVDCNSEFERQTGRPVEQLLKTKAQELLSMSNLENSVGNYIEDEIAQPDGKKVPIEYISNRIRVRNRDFVQSITRDISERYRAEQALRIAQEQYENLVEYYNQGAATLEILRQMVHEMGRPSRKTRITSPLNARELEILQLASKGMSNKSIAQKLSVSERTIGAHFRYIFTKMDVGSRTEAIYKALKNNWISL